MKSQFRRFDLSDEGEAQAFAFAAEIRARGGWAVVDCQGYGMRVSFEL